MKRIILFSIGICVSISLLAQTASDYRKNAERGDAEVQYSDAKAKNKMQKNITLKKKNIKLNIKKHEES